MVLGTTARAMVMEDLGALKPSSLPGVDGFDDEFGFGAEVPPADPVASPPFTGYGAGDPSVVPPGALMNFILATAEIAIVVGAVGALLLRLPRSSSRPPCPPLPSCSLLLLLGLLLLLLQ